MSILIPQHHQQCAVCCLPFFNDDNVIQFNVMPNGGVKGQIIPTDKVQGYQGVMQGGIISALHDAAMTHCLFALNLCAMTVKLDVRFIKPIPIKSLVTVKAYCLKSKRGLHVLESLISIDGQCYSKAEAKFMQV